MESEYVEFFNMGEFLENPMFLSLESNGAQLKFTQDFKTRGEKKKKITVKSCVPIKFIIIRRM